MRKRSFWNRLWMLFLGLFVIGVDSCAADWQVSDIGIKSPLVAWCNQNVLLARWTVSISPPVQTQVLIDANDLNRKIPIRFEKKKDFTAVDCVNGRVIIETRDLSSSERHLELYSMSIDHAPELIAWTYENFMGGSRRLSQVGATVAVPLKSGSQEGSSLNDENCAKNISKIIRVVCIREPVGTAISIESGAIAHYRWMKSVEPPPIKGLQGESGVWSAWLLYDINGNVIRRLDKDPEFQVDLLGYAISPDDSYIYAPCKRIAAAGSLLAVCRYPLKSGVAHWEEVFHLQESGWQSIAKVSVDNGKNIYFVRPALLGDKGGIWRFDAGMKDIVRIVAGTDSFTYFDPVVSPDGSKLAYLRSYELFIAKKN